MGVESLARLWRFDIKGGTTEAKSMTEGSRNFWHPTVSPDGLWVAATTGTVFPTARQGCDRRRRTGAPWRRNRRPSGPRTDSGSPSSLAAADQPGAAPGPPGRAGNRRRRSRTRRSATRLWLGCRTGAWPGRHRTEGITEFETSSPDRTSISWVIVLLVEGFSTRASHRAATSSCWGLSSDSGSCPGQVVSYFGLRRAFGQLAGLSTVSGSMRFRTPARRSSEYRRTRARQRALAGSLLAFYQAAAI